MTDESKGHSGGSAIDQQDSYDTIAIRYKECGSREVQNQALRGDNTVRRGERRGNHTRMQRQTIHIGGVVISCNKEEHVIKRGQRGSEQQPMTCTMAHVRTMV